MGVATTKLNRTSSSGPSVVAGNEFIGEWAETNSLSIRRWATVHEKQLGR